MNKLLIMSLKYLKDAVKKQNEKSINQEKKLEKINGIITLSRFNKRTDIDNILTEIKDVLSEYTDVNNDAIIILDDIISSVK